MLFVKHLTKMYRTGDLVQMALDDVSLGFRDQEFVAILGPSGSGKSTLLNMIGGLDHYDSGDIIIQGRSTNHYNDKDWDGYRNHSIGFIFQSYHLISHQTILSNVELALTLSNVGREERKQRALAALAKVGLEKQAHKLPNQLSGGQMQRVAIARALVNNPEVILADEPTGALDSHTSIQVMDLLKEVSKDRLVIMVTHNPELAETYADRMIHLKDGKIISDSDPLDEIENQVEGASKQRTKLRFTTALQLSLTNLKTKKGRTILTSFAGAIGIIGIALILSLSNGVNQYIRGVERQMLGNYPIALESVTYDLSQMMDQGMTQNMRQFQALEDVDPSKINSQNLVGDFVESHQGLKIENNLGAFKAYLDQEGHRLKDSLYAVEYDYDLEPYVYRQDLKAGLVKVSPALLKTDDSSSMMGLSSVWSQLPKSRKLMENQYTLLAGHYPKEANEVALILNTHHQVSDFTLYTIGLMDYEQMERLIDAKKNGQPYTDHVQRFSYEDALGLEFKVFGPGQLYKKTDQQYIDKSDDEAYIQEIYETGLDLKITAVIEAKEDASIASGVGYSAALIDTLARINNETAIVKEQVMNPQINVLTGKAFPQEHDKPTHRVGMMAQTSSYKITFKHADGTIISETMYEEGQAITKLPDHTPRKPSTATSQFVFIGWTDELGQYYTSANLPLVSQDVVYTATFLEVPIHPEDLDLEKMKEYLNQLIQGELDIRDILTEEQIQKLIQEILKQYPDMDLSTLLDQKQLDALIKKAMGQMDISDYLSDEQIEAIFKDYLESYADQIDMNAYMKAYMEAYFSDPHQVNAYMERYMEEYADEMMSSALANLSQDQLNALMAQYSVATPQNYEEVLQTIGFMDENHPTSIRLYPVDFEHKGHVETFIKEYNEHVDPNDQVTYNDLIASLTKGMTDIVDTISYILIAFVAISLVVSSIMIAIITYISVLERSKEIGILRALGASKGDVSKIFNAETFIEGFLSGLLGIGMTVLMNIPINRIVYQMTGVPEIARLPWQAGGLLIVISILLTLLAGFIPSRMASKKDPVKALKSE